MSLFSPSYFAPMLFLTSCILPICATSQPAKAQTISSEVEATNLLLHGRRYEHAAERIQAAIIAKPTDYVAYLTLGCAYADRVAALAYAETFTRLLKEEQKAYPKTLKEWEDGQKDKDNYYYGEPRPKPPPSLVFPTRDDNVPYRLTRSQLAARLSDLFARAEAAWEKAFECAKTDSEKAQVEYVRGWGLRLLVFSSDAVGGPKETVETEPEPDEDDNSNDRESGAVPEPKEPPLTITNLPTKKQITAAFEQALALAPNEARYWQAMGDWESSDEKKAAAYEKALALKPKNGPLWAELYRRTLKETYSPDPDFLLKPDVKRATVEKGIGYLGKAGKYDGTNAWYLYEEATLRIKREMFSTYQDTRRAIVLSTRPADAQQAQKAVQSEESLRVGKAVIALIEAGNQRYYFHAPRYEPSVPGLLAPGWRYLTDTSLQDWEFGARLRELARAASGYGQAMTYEKGNLEEGTHALGAVVAMGLKLGGDFSTKDSTGDALLIQSLIGRAIASIGLGGLANLYEKSGYAERAAFIKAEREALLAYGTQRTKSAMNQENQLWEYYFKK